MGEFRMKSFAASIEVLYPLLTGQPLTLTSLLMVSSVSKFPGQAHNTKFFRQGRFRGIWALRYIFPQKHKIEGPAGKNFGSFSPRYSQNCILNGKFNTKMDTIRTFFPKSGHFFDF